MNWKKLDSWSDIPKDVNEIALDREGMVRLQRREGTANGWKLPTHGFMFDDDYAALNLTPYLPAMDPVDISPAEAAARMVEAMDGGRIPDLEFCDGSVWLRVTSATWTIFGIFRRQWRIPACPPTKQKLTIEVPARVEVPDEFTIRSNHFIEGRIPAKVIHREGE